MKRDGIKVARRTSPVALRAREGVRLALMSCRLSGFRRFPSPDARPTQCLRPQNACVLVPKGRKLGAFGLWFEPTTSATLIRRGAVSIARASSSSPSGQERGKWTVRWNPQDMIGDKILRSIAGATASPIAQFIPSPTTVLHSVDPRIKLVWLLTLVVLPARSHMIMRIGTVLYLSMLSVFTLPKNVWMDQLGRVFFLSGVLFIMLALGSDGVPPLVQSRLPPSSITGLPHIPMSVDAYSYSIIKMGPLQLTRKGLSVATTAACLSFTVFQSASLCLATTMPEHLTSAFRWFMLPLEPIGVPVSEVTLTLLLSLRFINIVFDEVRNVALGIVARGVNWRDLTFIETLDVFVMYIRRIFQNIFDHAEQISQAMIVRGFRGDSKKHKLYNLSRSSFGIVDLVSIVLLLVLTTAAILTECFLS